MFVCTSNTKLEFSLIFEKPKIFYPVQSRTKQKRNQKKKKKMAPRLESANICEFFFLPNDNKINRMTNNGNLNCVNISGFTQTGSKKTSR